MKAIYSYWENNKQKINGGFRTKKELAITLLLSVELAKKQFSEVELVTNTYGKELLIDHYKIPFDSVRVELDQFDNTLHADLWAYAKIYAYSIQNEPFIHIDNDVLIWEKIPDEILQSDLFFQNKEFLKTHTGYKRLLDEAKGFPRIDFDIISSAPDFAYNCGIVGVNDLEIIKEWHEVVKQYLFSPKNQVIWDSIFDKHSQNHLFEQYFISSIIKNKNIEDKVKTLLKDDFYLSATRDFKFTHLWGPSKRDDKTMRLVKNRLFLDYPQYKEIFTQPETHSDIFEDIYKSELWGKDQGSGGGSSPQITFEYRKFLQNFLKEYNIKSVIDLGCGDWQFSKLIDWDDINYLGLDCVKPIIDLCNEKFGEQNIQFALQDVSKPIHEFADLLIVKDVLIHWTDKEIKDFFNNLKTLNVKYILITNQVVKGKTHVDILTAGEFHEVDLNSDPFNYDLQEIFVWPNDPKITYLIVN